MNKCDKYHLYDKWLITYNPATGNAIRNTHQVGVCWGTKGQDECTCGGDTAKCDFYDHIRTASQRNASLIPLYELVSQCIDKVGQLDLSNWESEEVKRAGIITLLSLVKDELKKKNL
jgi:hypothetical protein